MNRHHVERRSPTRRVLRFLHDKRAGFGDRRSALTTLSVMLPFFAAAFGAPPVSAAQTVLLRNATVHTVTRGIITNGQVLIIDGKIANVGGPDLTINLPTETQSIDLEGDHLYPGLIALDTSLGLTEVEAVRATRDTTEVGDYTPDVESWIAVNPDSELIPVARANGVACFEPSPKGSIVAGQSALLTAHGWTFEEMALKKPAALHLYWPAMELNTREKSRDPKVKPLEEQAKERRSKLRSIQEFFDEAKAYSKAREAADNGGSSAPARIPAWEAMLPYVRGELPVILHADEVRQIRAAVNWAVTNHFKAIIAGGRDAAMLAGLLATNGIPVIYQSMFIQPPRDTDSYDVQFRTPELLRDAGVKVAFSFGTGGFATTSIRNLPYAAAQAIAFGLPEIEALKNLTLHPAEFMNVADRLGSIEAGKDATLFVCDGSVFDLRSNVKQMWIAGDEVPLESRHTRLYDKYRNRPKR
jgi:imidazolonepropionase-like amidohydrolase